jgi:hypothetical protein
LQDEFEGELGVRFPVKLVAPHVIDTQKQCFVAAVGTCGSLPNPSLRYISDGSAGRAAHVALGLRGSGANRYGEPWSSGHGSEGGGGGGGSSSNLSQAESLTVDDLVLYGDAQTQQNVRYLDAIGAALLAYAHVTQGDRARPPAHVMWPVAVCYALSPMAF